MLEVKLPSALGQSPTGRRRSIRWWPGSQGATNPLPVNLGSREHHWTWLPGLLWPGMSRRNTCTHPG